MAVSQIRPEPDEDAKNSMPGTVVDADDGDPRLDPEEREEIAQGLSDIETGKLDLADESTLSSTEDILRRRGYGAAALEIQTIAHEIGQMGHTAVHRGQGEVQHADEHYRARQVAQLITTEPQQLVTWQAAVKKITQSVKESVPESVFVVAAHGNVAVAQLRRATLLQQGEWLINLEAGVVRTADDTFQIGVGVVNFVASVLTIFDNIPEPVKHTIGRALQVLLALFR